MLFYLHYVLMTSGLSGVSVLLAVYFREYTDASQGEIGVLLMTFPFVSFLIKPLFCSMADRSQAHRFYIICSLFVEMFGYLPFAIIPFFPTFYTNYPRWSWYILVLACQLGNCGLGVAWSLGDCLAMNMAQKTGTPYGRMRLMGTVGWGVYGFIIGQINEVPMLPKYIPAFIILHMSLVVEILIMSFWRAEDFVMFDPLTVAPTNSLQQSQQPNCLNNNKQDQCQQQPAAVISEQFGQFAASLPSSLGGTLRLNSHTANVFRDVFSSDDFHKQLQVINQQQQATSGGGGGDLHLQAIKSSLDLELGNGNSQPQADQLNDWSSSLQRKQQLSNISEGEVSNGGQKDDDDSKLGQNKAKRTELKKNPQLVLLKIIFLEDGRLIKYAILFALYGFLMAPMNFLFLSMEEVCSKRGYNFSQLAGGVLISQATIETLGFLVVPWMLIHVSRSYSFGFSFMIMAIRFIFYSVWYYTGEISPYWALIGEWGHGIGFAIICTIQADLALMFANQSRLLIPELRRLGYLSELSPETPSELIEAEETSIKMALRATMQALFDGFMNGLGQGVGCLICGLYIELYDYVSLWRLFYIIALSSFVVHQLIELSKWRWSDAHKPRKGTKAFEIRQLDAKAKELTRQQHCEQSNSQCCSPSNNNNATGASEQQQQQQKAAIEAKQAECC